MSMSLQKLDDDEKLTQKIFVSGQARKMWTINESGLYTLILRSNKPNAKKFRKWVISPIFQTKGLRMVSLSSMTCLCCISSEYKMSQPFSIAEAIIKLS